MIALGFVALFVVVFWLVVLAGLSRDLGWPSSDREPDDDEVEQWSAKRPPAANE